VNHEHETLDFHSLRHSGGAWLAMTGAHPKEVQAVMRHSTITLTMDTYGHLFPGAEAVARLPDVLGDGPEALRATGTCDAQAERSGGGGERPPAGEKGQHLGQQLNGERRHLAASSGETPETGVEKGVRPKVLPIADFGEAEPVLATAGESRPGGI